MTDSFLTPFQAVKFILVNKKIWHYIAIPIVINVLTFSVLGTLAIWWLFSYFENIFWQIFLAIIIFVIVIALITMMANIFAAPFNELLSHRTEELLKGRKIKEKGHVLKSIGQEIIIFFVFIIVQIILFFLNFIPGIGTILYILINIILLSYFYCFQYMDYTMDRHNIPFFRRWKVIFQKPWPSFWFGFAAGIGMIIPLVNLFWIPVCVVAGTMLYSKYESSHSS